MGLFSVSNMLADPFLDMAYAALKTRDAAMSKAWFAKKRAQFGADRFNVAVGIAQVATAACMAAMADEVAQELRAQFGEVK